MNESADKSVFSSEAYWDARYHAITSRSSGKPGVVVRRFVTPLTPGRALELGCGRGDDAIWLASIGWSVVAVDVSSVALKYAAENAARAPVSGHILFEQHDLVRSFPEGSFDLVTATHLAAFPREQVFKRAAAAVAIGGRLLIVDPVPPRPAEPIKVAGGHYPTLKETLACLQVRDDGWEQLQVGAVERSTTQRDDRGGVFTDNVIFLKRL